MRTQAAADHAERTERATRRMLLVTLVTSGALGLLTVVGVADHSHWLFGLPQASVLPSGSPTTLVVGSRSGAQRRTVPSPASSRGLGLSVRPSAREQPLTVGPMGKRMSSTPPLSRRSPRAPRFILTRVPSVWSTPTSVRRRVCRLPSASPSADTGLLSPSPRPSSNGTAVVPSPRGTDTPILPVPTTASPTPASLTPSLAPTSPTP